MLTEPEVGWSPPQQTAVVHITIPRAEIGSIMGPTIGEVSTGIAAQGIIPSGPWFARYLKMEPGTFEMEVGIPVETPVAPAGRLEPSELPAGRVARATYRGPYEGLHPAWGEFGRWIEESGLVPRQGQWESYVRGPESDPDPTGWRTELVIPVEDLHSLNG
jgi:effector-binding domain-containing protein